MSAAIVHAQGIHRLRYRRSRDCKSRTPRPVVGLTFSLVEGLDVDGRADQEGGARLVHRG